MIFFSLALTFKLYEKINNKKKQNKNKMIQCVGIPKN